MKHCPSCKTNYADDTLQFCLQDGTQLVSYPAAETQTIVFNDAEAETVVRLEQPPPPSWQQPSQPHQIQPQQIPQQSSQQIPPQNVPPYAAPQKSRTGLIVFLTALVMLLLFGAGLGAWFFLGNRKSAANNATRDVPTPAQTKTPANANANSNANASPTASPTASKTPSPTPSFDAEDVKSEVSSKMDEWRSAMESGDLDSVMSHYAGRLEYYYRSGGVSSGFVRSNKQKAFDQYYTFEVNISDLRVTPDETGQKATAVFNKTWMFEGSDDRSEGTVRSQFQLTKIGGQWMITGEKDL